MSKVRFRLDSTPRKVDRLPFASESELQQFVEDHSTELLGVKVIASARKGGNMVSKIDLLAIHPSGRPWIIECKLDLVGHGALNQLQRYRRTLQTRPGDVKILAERHGLTLQSKPDPVLVLIGYRYDQTVEYGDTLCLAYRYDFEFTSEEFQHQQDGHVSLHHIKDFSIQSQRLPKVCKDIATHKRLIQRAPELAESFWKLDAELQDLGAKVTYGKIVRYRRDDDIFANAFVCPSGAIRWQISSLVNQERDSDVAKVRKLLKKAYRQAR